MEAFAVHSTSRAANCAHTNSRCRCDTNTARLLKACKLQRTPAIHLSRAACVRTESRQPRCSGGRASTRNITSEWRNRTRAWARCWRAAPIEREHAWRAHAAIACAVSARILHASLARICGWPGEPDEREQTEQLQQTARAAGVQASILHALCAPAILWGKSASRLANLYAARVSAQAAILPASCVLLEDGSSSKLAWMRA